MTNSISTVCKAPDSIWQMQHSKMARIALTQNSILVNSMVYANVGFHKSVISVLPTYVYNACKDMEQTYDG